MGKPFVSLHNHTTFSFRDAYGTPEQHAERAAEIGSPALAITDHGSISGWVRHQKACREVGIKPIFGCEFYMVNSVKKNVQRKQHLTVLAMNLDGLRNIMALVTRSNHEGFYYKPTIDPDMLLEHGDGLFVMSGCMFGAVATAIWKKEDDELALKRAEWFAKNFGDRFAIEIQAFPFQETQAVASGGTIIGSAAGIPTVMTVDAHYPAPSDERARKLLLRLQPGWTPDGTNAPLFQPTRKEAFAAMKRYNGEVLAKPDIIRAMDMTTDIAERCNVELPRAETVHYVPEPGSDTQSDYKKAIRRGWKLRGLDKLHAEKRKKYKARLQREVAIIREKGFEDYLMVVADVIRWSKEQDIMVGPARGSSCGSLVCYLLEITEVDPVEWDLLFERFIDLNREDPPDIDTDFEDHRRGEVIEYLEGKYGADRVASLCTFAKYKPKNSLDDVARAFSVPNDPVETIKGFVIERSSADARASMCLLDTIESFPAAQDIVNEFPDLKKAALIEGQYRQQGKHACGVVIGEEPLDLHTARVRAGDGSTSVAFEGKDAASIGFLKLDLLGLRALSVIATILNRIGKTPRWLYSLPMDDEETYRGFQRGDLTGVFQFTGQSTMSVCKQMPPEHFMELADINALSRPGPLHSGSTTVYIAARNGENPIKKYHPLYDEVTKDTYGVIVYQEQIMQVGRKMADMSWEQVSSLRTIISKKLGVEEFTKFKKIFMEGAIRNGVEADAAEEIWANICTHGSWSFNKSHAVAYAYISYLMMYLKVHYPLEFVWAALLVETDKDKRLHILRDYLNEGGICLPVHLNKSGVSWEIDYDEGGIRPGLMELHGFGEVTATRLVKGQPYEDLDDLKARTIPREVNRGHHRKLIERGLILDDGSVGSGDDDVWGLRKLKAEIEELPITHTIEDCDWGRERFVVVAGKIIEHNVKDIFEVAYSKRGKVLNRDEVKRPDLAAFINITLEDHTDSIYCTFDRFVYPRVRETIFSKDNQDDDVFMVKGTKTRGFRKIFAKSIVNVSLQAREAQELIVAEEKRAKKRRKKKGEEEGEENG